MLARKNEWDDAEVTTEIEVTDDLIAWGELAHKRTRDRLIEQAMAKPETAEWSHGVTSNSGIQTGRTRSYEFTQPLPILGSRGDK